MRGGSVLNRRGFITYGAAFAYFSSVTRVLAANEAQIVDQAISDFSNSFDLSAPNYAFREFAEDFPALNLERAPSKLKPSKLTLSDKSRELIIAFEVSSKAVYIKKYQSPVWPGGRSGVTMGIGYDLGYVSEDGFASDWDGFIQKADIDALKVACGVTGKQSKPFVSVLNGVTVPWDAAINQFNIEIAKYVTLTQNSLPNFTSLPPHCRGVLASLVYNRGPSFDVPSKKDPNGRYREMREIRALMASRQFEKIPEQIEKMVRIWPTVPGLIRRRKAEAALFVLGLQE